MESKDCSFDDDEEKKEEAGEDRVSWKRTLKTKGKKWKWFHVNLLNLDSMAIKQTD